MENDVILEISEDDFYTLYFLVLGQKVENIPKEKIDSVMQKMKKIEDSLKSN